MQNNSIIRNTSALFLAHLAGRILTFALTILLPRYLQGGFADLGKYFTALWLTNLVAGLTELGLYTPVIREIARDRKRASLLISNALAIRLALCLIASAIMIAFARFVYTGQIALLIYILGISAVVSAITQTLWRVFRAYERMGYEAASLLLERALVFLLGIGLVLRGNGIISFAVAVLIATALNFSVTLSVMMWKFARPSLKFVDKEICRDLLRQALPFALGGTLSIIYFRIDGLLIKQLLGAKGNLAVGWYGTGYNFVTALTIIPGAFMGAVFPVLSRMYVSSRSAVGFLYTGALKLMLVIALPLAIGTIFMADRLVLVLYPSQHFAAQDQEALTKILQILIWAGALIFLNTVLVTMFRAADKRRAFWVIMTIGVSLNIISNLILIPRYKHLGAAMSMIVSESFFLVSGLWYVRSRLCRLTQLGFVLKALFASAFLALCLFVWRYVLAPGGSSHAILVVPIAIILYSGAILVQKTITREDIAMLKGYSPEIQTRNRTTK